MTTHKIAEGENLSVIARQYGFRDWRTLYDAPENADFRTERPNPSLVFPGDELVIPERTLKKVPLQEAQGRRTFKLAKQAAPPSDVRFVFETEEGQPFPKLNVLVQTAGGQKMHHSDANGVLLVRDSSEMDSVQLVQIRDSSTSPIKNWDRFGGEFAKGASHVVSLPFDPIDAALPIVLARSSRRPRFAEDGSPAQDMTHGDYTKSQIENLRFMFELGKDLDTTPASEFFDDFENMATTLFATGDLEGNIKRMIAHMRGNTGSDYSDPILTREVRNHPSTGRFENQIRDQLTKLLNAHQGDPSTISSGEMKLVGRPRFNTASDKVGGLTIAINDTHAYDVDLIEYEIEGKQYQGKFRVIIYDHFGLDEPDVVSNSGSSGGLFGVLGGFRAWFILQHLVRFGYQPFVTRIELDYDFSGAVR